MLRNTTKVLCTASDNVLCLLEMKKFKPHDGFLRAKKFCARWVRLLVPQRVIMEFEYLTFFFEIHAGSSRYENLSQPTERLFRYFSRGCRQAVFSMYPRSRGCEIFH